MACDGEAMSWTCNDCGNALPGPNTGHQCPAITLNEKGEIVRVDGEWRRGTGEPIGDVLAGLNITGVKFTAPGPKGPWTRVEAERPRTFMDRAVDGEWTRDGALYGAFVQACEDADWDPGESLGMTLSEFAIVRTVSRPEPALAYIVERRREERRLRAERDGAIAQREVDLTLNREAVQRVRAVRDETIARLSAENAALSAEVAKWKALAESLDSLRSEGAQARAEMALSQADLFGSLKAENAALRALVQEAEWAGADASLVCPWCLGGGANALEDADAPHKPICKAAKLMGWATA